MDDWDYNEEFPDDEGNEIQQDIDEVKESRQTLDEDEDPEVEGEDDTEARAKKIELVMRPAHRFFGFTLIISLLLLLLAGL